jgi:hypothetical protein
MQMDLENDSHRLLKSIPAYLSGDEKSLPEFEKIKFKKENFPESEKKRKKKQKKSLRKRQEICTNLFFTFRKLRKLGIRMKYW